MSKHECCIDQLDLTWKKQRNGDSELKQYKYAKERAKNNWKNFNSRTE